MKKNINQKTLLFACLTAIVTACGGGETSPTSGSNTPNNNSVSAAIPIGIAFSQTGNAALLGQDGIHGVKIAEKYFNDQGGVNGTPIKLVIQDAGGEEQTAMNAFQALINKDKVVGIIGPTLSQQAFSADPIAERAKIPVIAASNTAKGIPEIGDYIARVSAPIVTVAPNAVKAAIKQNPNIKKVAVFYAQNDTFNKTETEIFQKTAKDLGLEIVTVQKFQTTDTDFQSQATNAINLKPDLAIISGLAADGGNLVRQLRELGYKGLIVGGNGLNTSNVYKVCKALCDGVIIAQAYSPEHPNEINKTFRQTYLSTYKIEPPQFSGQAFTAVQVYVEALKSLDKKTKISSLSLPQLRSELNKEILAGKYDTPVGEISFTPTGEVVQKDFYVAQIKMEKDGSNGKFTFIK
ncbi:ABC transporter substrate-binding protein [Calothrix sp. UHCC 0171]|uniref:ABC transporter substrate-binding protein n=1 Tax=Calothrix sp. UHCC 0171 TaxID=3110245 RepID=UPI002B1F4CAE|nr:ABC transporter substrate-binding protein [Calothrix sp. UHCC 0171]MEA5572113.1 ABC transporter substrate-binding protein [Calothrix sp. UHCC 0171]